MEVKIRFSATDLDGNRCSRLGSWTLKSRDSGEEVKHQPAES